MNEQTFSGRFFLKVSGAFVALAAVPTSVKALYHDVKNFLVPPKETIPSTIRINKKDYQVTADTRTTLLEGFQGVDNKLKCPDFFKNVFRLNSKCYHKSQCPQ